MYSVTIGLCKIKTADKGRYPYAPVRHFIWKAEAEATQLFVQGRHK